MQLPFFINLKLHKMKFKLLFSIFGFYSLITFSQYNVVIIDEDYDPNEPSIEINPYNTDEIVVGANLNSYYYSHDGGFTWNEETLTSTYGVWGDPAIACDKNGDFYFFHLSNPNTGSWLDRIVCQKSTDAGQTLNNGSFTGLNGSKDQDKEWVSIDRSNNNIYLTWTQFDLYNSSNPDDKSNIMFSKSEDGGASWTAAITINETSGDCIDDDNTVEGAVPAVGSNGEVFVAWAGKKTDGANAIMFDKSLDGGNTWLENDIYVTDFIGGWNYAISGLDRCNGLPILKCDTSATSTNGTLYINWTDQHNGSNDTDVWLIKSTDGGETWSERIRVNDDVAGKQQFLTWFDIDQTNGKLYFIFYDRRNYSDNQTDVYMAISEDGGTTFENIKISESPFNPSASFFGDYTNISVHNGKIAPIWARADGANLSLRTIVPDGSRIKDIESDLLVSDVYPNPSDNEFYFPFKLMKDKKVSLSIMDLFGKEICSIYSNKEINAGKHIATFNAKEYNLNSGIYLFKFSDGRKQIIKKFVYSK